MKPETLQEEATRICDAALADKTDRIALVCLRDLRTGLDAFAAASAGLPSGDYAKNRKEMLETLRAVLVQMEGN